MSDPREIMERFQRVASAIDPGLTDVEVELLVDGAHQRRRRRVVRRVGLVAAGGAIGALMFVFLIDQPGALSPGAGSGTSSSVASSAPAEVGAAAFGPALRLADGSLVTRLDAGATVALVDNRPAHITLELRRGRERFDVVPRPRSQRVFQVRAGAVTVTVVGTAFTVERIADRIGVAVEHGTVNVDWGQGARSLHAGESGWFPPLAVDDDSAPGRTGGDGGGDGRSSGRGGEAPGPRADVPTEDSRPSLPGGARTARRESPPSPVREGAPPASASPPPSPSGVAPPPADLGAPTAEQILRTADAARATGHIAEAAALLRRLVADRPADPRAPLAAFTLGRLLLRELGRAREAATAFAQARALAPDGPLAEDALAREAEALAQAGAPGEARERAHAYLLLYPEGRHASALKSLGGAE